MAKRCNGQIICTNIIDYFFFMITRLFYGKAADHQVGYEGLLHRSADRVFGSRIYVQFLKPLFPGCRIAQTLFRRAAHLYGAHAPLVRHSGDNST